MVSVLTPSGFKQTTSEEIALAALDDTLADLRLAIARLERAGWNATGIETQCGQISEDVLFIVQRVKTLKTKVGAQP